MEEIDDDGFEDYSLSTETEKLSYAIERATENWLLQLARNEPLSGQEDKGEEPGLVTASEGILRHPSYFDAAPTAVLTCLDDTMPVCSNQASLPIQRGILHPQALFDCAVAATTTQAFQADATSGVLEEFKHSCQDRHRG
jgi:hypothetical protein